MTHYRKLLRWLGGRLMSVGCRVMLRGISSTVENIKPATKKDLDALAATADFRRGPGSTFDPHTGLWFESDEEFRQRIANTNRRLH